MYSEEKARLIELYKDGFPEDSDEYVTDFFEHVFDEKNVVTRQVDGEIVSAAHIVMKKLKFFDKILDIPYLVAVSTLTEYRGKRLVEEVIYNALKVMEERHLPFVLLYPFNHNYYKKYGFATIDKSIDYSSIIGRFRRVKSNDVDAFYNIFMSYTDSHDIAIYRSYEDMKRRLDVFYIDSDESYLLYEGDRLVGYALMYGEQIEECILLEDSISTIELSHTKENVQGRIVDVKKALQSVIFQDNVNIDVVLRVKDTFYKDRIVRLTIKNGRQEVLYLDGIIDSIPTIDITIEELTLLVFGRLDIQGLGCFRHAKVSLIDKY